MEIHWRARAATDWFSQCPVNVHWWQLAGTSTVCSVPGGECCSYYITTGEFNENDNKDQPQPQPAVTAYCSASSPLPLVRTSQFCPLVTGPPPLVTMRTSLACQGVPVSPSQGKDNLSLTEQDRKKAEVMHPHEEPFNSPPACGFSVLAIGPWSCPFRCFSSLNSWNASIHIFPLISYFGYITQFGVWGLQRTQRDQLPFPEPKYGQGIVLRVGLTCPYSYSGDIDLLPVCDRPSCDGKQKGLWGTHAFFIQAAASIFWRAFHRIKA